MLPLLEPRRKSGADHKGLVKMLRPTRSQVVSKSTSLSQGFDCLLQILDQGPLQPEYVHRMQALSM